MKNRFDTTALFLIFILLNINSYSQDLKWFKDILPEENLDVVDLAIYENDINNYTDLSMLVKYNNGLNLQNSDLPGPTSGSGYAVIFASEADFSNEIELSCKLHFTGGSPSKLLMTNDGATIILGTKNSSDSIILNADNATVTSSTEGGIFMIYSKYNYHIIKILKATGGVSFGDLAIRSNPSPTYSTDDYLYIGGDFSGGTLSFGSRNVSATSQTAFIAKFNIYYSSNWSFACNSIKKIEGAHRVSQLSYSNNRLHVLGHFTGTLKPNLGQPSNNQITNGNNNIFIAQYNNYLSYISAHKLWASPYSMDMVTDKNSNIYLSKESSSNMYLDLINNTELINDKAFVAKYNSNLQFQWKIEFPVVYGYGGTEEPVLMGVDSSNYLCIFRPFVGSYNFDANGIGLNLTSDAWEETGEHARNYFLGKYKSDGTLLTGGQLRTTKSYTPESINHYFATNLQSKKVGIIGVSKRIDFDLSARTENIIQYPKKTFYCAIYDHCTPSQINFSTTNYTACEGGLINTAAPSTSNGVGTLSYNWYKGNTKLMNGTFNEGIFTQAQTPQLRITNATTQATGTYRLELTSRCDIPRLSNPIQVNITPKTHITSQPIGQIVCENTTANFSVTADNNPTYQWQVNEGTGAFTNISGANSSTLSITNVNPSMAGYQYRCKVIGQSNCNELYSEIAHLGVNPIPLIQTQPSNTEICEGNTSSMSIATNGAGAAYQWQIKNGSTWENLSNNANYSGVNSSTLNFMNVPLSFSGKQYRCKLSSLASCGSAVYSQKALLNVHPSAVIQSQSNNNSICKGSNTIFSINATGYNLSYQWQIKNGSTWENLSNSAVYSHVNTSSLNLNETPISLNNKQYRCLVSSPCSDDINSNPIVLNVAPLPNVSLNSENPEVCQGLSATISVPNQANQTYQWQHNNLNIEGATTNSLEINEAGLYKVYVSNTLTTCSASSSYATLSVHNLPTPVINASGELVSCVEDSITLKLNETYSYYLWNDNSNLDSLVVKNNGAYSVKVTDANNCSNTAEINIVEQFVPTPNICMVSVDTASKKNLIVWEHPDNKEGIAYYNIYKLQSGAYQLLGHIAANDTSEYLDPTSAPSEHADRYVIASVDECGITGNYSPYHQTMNLSVLTGTEGNVSLVWNKYIDEAGDQTPVDYIIYRGLDHLTEHDRISGGLSSYNFNILDAQPHEHFMIVIDLPNACAPLTNRAVGGPYYKSNSNIEDEGITGPSYIAENAANNKVQLYPNPAKDYTNIKTDFPINEISLYNIIGERIGNYKQLNTFEYRIDLNELKPGVYTVRVNNHIIRKVIVGTSIN